jgi:hypothetical protein
MRKLAAPHLSGAPKPTPHIVMCFASADDATTAMLMLHERGFGGAEAACCTAAQMRARLANPPVSSSQDWSVIATRRELARRGYSFVLVRAMDDAEAAVIKQIADDAHAQCVQPGRRHTSEELSRLTERSAVVGSHTGRSGLTCAQRAP